LYDNYKKVK